MSRIAALLAVALAAAFVFVACGGRPPVRPNEELMTTIAGIAAEGRSAPAFAFRDGTAFAPPDGAIVRQLWPYDFGVRPGVTKGDLVLGGQAPDGSWWYQAVAPDLSLRCWLVYNGAFDEGATVLLTSGALVPKAPDFRISYGDSVATPGPDSFVTTADAKVCLSATGSAIYLLQPVYQ